MTSFRKRELLLSLKYSTIEACFSVPMLTLTTSNLAFAIGFALKALHWGPWEIGWMAAAPHIAYFLQPPLTHFLQKHFSLYQIMRIGFLVGALPWFFVSFFDWFGDQKNLAFALIVFVSNLGNSIAGVAWSASISEVVPLQIRGKFFGRRNLIYGTWTLLVVLAAGQYVSYKANALATFGTLFALAAMARLIGLFFLTRMKFPHGVMERRVQRTHLTDFLAVFHDKNYLKLMLFVGIWGLCLGMGTPFYNVFVLSELPLDLGDLMLFSTISSIGGLVSYSTWGALSDRFGNKPVMFICTALLGISAMLSWLFASPAHYVHLYLNYFVVGFMTAGFQLCQFSLMIKLVPADKKTQYISTFFACTSLLTALGPILGGQLLNLIPEKMGTFNGQPVLNFHVLFVGSLLIGLLTTLVLQRLQEPAERSWRELVRVMRGMRAFNPVLGLGMLAQFMVTPRAVARAVCESMRTLRRQKSAVTDVGEELVGESWRALRQRFDKDK